MKKNLLKIALVAMMVIAISFSGCTTQTDLVEAKSTFTDTDHYWSDIPTC